MAAAVARLVQLIPPAQVDLVDEVLVRAAAGTSISPSTGRRCT